MAFPKVSLSVHRVRSSYKNPQWTTSNRGEHKHSFNPLEKVGSELFALKQFSIGFRAFPIWTTTCPKPKSWLMHQVDPTQAKLCMQFFQTTVFSIALYLIETYLNILCLNILCSIARNTIRVYLRKFHERSWNSTRSSCTELCVKQVTVGVHVHCKGVSYKNPQAESRVMNKTAFWRIFDPPPHEMAVALVLGTAPIFEADLMEKKQNKKKSHNFPWECRLHHVVITNNVKFI